VTRIQPADPDKLRVIMCIAFDHRAPAGDVKRFKQCIVECPFVVQSIQLTGTFDFMVEASFAGLTEYQEQLSSLADILARVVARYEANFVCKRIVRETNLDRALWVPCHEGLQRLDCERIDMVQAEGDYMRVQSGSQNWLVHSTLRDFFTQLPPGEFVCVHRSLILRCTYIERMLHEGRRWVARLQNGERKSIARSHVKDVLRALHIDPTAVRDTFATTVEPLKGAGQRVRDTSTAR
jgi:DNA-binding LytR/AlgR family response regulator